MFEKMKSFFSRKKKNDDKEKIQSYAAQISETANKPDLGLLPNSKPVGYTPKKRSTYYTGSMHQDDTALFTAAAVIDEYQSTTVESSKYTGSGGSYGGGGASDSWSSSSSDSGSSCDSGGSCGGGGD